MNIAIIAQNRKKELMVQFCIAYCGVLSQHELCATGTTGKLIMEATGLKVNCLLPGISGGDEQVAARAAYNELDMVLIFRDPLGQIQRRFRFHQPAASVRHEQHPLCHQCGHGGSAHPGPDPGRPGLA